MGCQKKSVSLPQDLLLASEARRQRLGYASFSQYIQFLIQDDVLTHKNHVRSAHRRRHPKPPAP